MSPSRRRDHRASNSIVIQKGVEEAIVLSLFDLANHLTRRGERLAAQAGLTTQQWLVLLQVAHDPNFPGNASAKPPVLASDIADARGVARASISVPVAALKKKGLIDEQADPADGRRKRLVLTPSGAATLAAVEPVRRAANRQLVSQLSQRERQAFLRHLQSCLAILWEAYEAERTEHARARLERTRA